MDGGLARDPHTSHCGAARTLPILLEWGNLPHALPYPSSNKDLFPQQQLPMCCCWDVCTKISLEALVCFLFVRLFLRKGVVEEDGEFSSWHHLRFLGSSEGSSTDSSGLHRCIAAWVQALPWVAGGGGTPQVGRCAESLCASIPGVPPSPGLRRGWTRKADLKT